MATITMELTSAGTATEKKHLITNRPKRKLSTPTTLLPPQENPVFRRRFSNVGDAARKLSSSIGWRSMVGSSPSEEVLTVGRGLCALYMRTKLKRAGVFNKKLGLTRVRSAIGSLEGCGTLVREIFPALQCACSEMERMHPRLFAKITRQTGFGSSGSISGLLVAVGQQLFVRTEPTWGKVVTIYCIAGNLAVEVVRQGRSECLPCILDDMTELLEDRLALWMTANGGWAGLTAQCRTQNEDIPMKEYLTIIGFVIAALFVAYFIIKCCSKFSS